MQEISAPNNPGVIPQVREDPLGRFLAGQLSERTRKAYYTDLKEFFQTDQITPDDVRRTTFADITDYRNELATIGRKRSTINRKLSSLKAFFRMMVASGLVDQNPADAALVRGYRLDESFFGKAIGKRALKQLFDVVSEEKDDLVRTRDMAMLHLLTFGGLRRSEVANISWSDLSQEGVFYVLNLPDTKSGGSQEIKLQPVVVHHLWEYNETLKLNGYPVSEKVFISLSRNQSHGKPLTSQSVNGIVRRYARKAGLSQNITAHMFRHTCCTLSIEGGAKPQQVQAHLRHKDLKTTMRYYENRERLTDNASDYIRIE